MYSGRPDACVSAVEAPLWDSWVIGIASISQRRNLGLRHKGMWALDQNPPLLPPVQHPTTPRRQPVGLRTDTWTPCGKAWQPLWAEHCVKRRRVRPFFPLAQPGKVGLPRRILRSRPENPRYSLGYQKPPPEPANTIFMLR